MEPIQNVLSRIRWDSAFGVGRFSIGYFDRVSNEVVVAPLTELHFSREDHFAFEFLDDEGETHHVPLHRIRDVYRDGQLIWHRHGPL